MKIYQKMAGKSGGNLRKSENLEICSNQRRIKAFKAKSRFSKGNLVEIWKSALNTREIKVFNCIKYAKADFLKEIWLSFYNPYITRAAADFQISQKPIYKYI